MLFEERGVLRACIIGFDAAFDFDTGLLKQLRATAREMIGIASTEHHALDSGRDDCICAGWRFALMRAGLEGDVERGAARTLASIAQRFDFGVRAAVFNMKTFADDFAVNNDNGTDHGIWMNASPAVFGEAECCVHVPDVDAVLCVHATGLSEPPGSRNKHCRG